VKSTHLSVTEKLVVEGDPQVPRNAAMPSNDLLEILRDRVGEPVEDDIIHSSPCKFVGEGIVRLDVVGEGVSRKAINMRSRQRA
jgi:hypothetical protein